MRVNESRADVGNEIYAPPRPLYFWALWGSSGVLRRPPAGPDREPSALSRPHVVNRLCIRGEDTNDGKCLIPRPRSAPALAFGLFLKANKQGTSASNVQAKYVYLSCNAAVPLNYYEYGELLRGREEEGELNPIGDFAAFVDLTLSCAPSAASSSVSPSPSAYKVFTGRVCPSG